MYFPPVRPTRSESWYSDDDGDDDDDDDNNNNNNSFSMNFSKLYAVGLSLDLKTHSVQKSDFRYGCFMEVASTIFRSVIWYRSSDVSDDSDA